jgi:hypothetical protein
MAALIEFVCVADHGVHTDPSITLEQRAWAYCGGGGSGMHKWVRIDPTAVETVRSRPSLRPHRAANESDESSFAHAPGR